MKTYKSIGVETNLRGSWKTLGIFTPRLELIRLVLSFEYFVMQGGDLIASKDIGLVLRILGQNPTEDQIVEMVMKVSGRDCESNLFI